MSKLQRATGVTGSFVLALISIGWLYITGNALASILLQAITKFSLSSNDILGLVFCYTVILFEVANLILNIYHITLCSNKSTNPRLVGAVRIGSALLGCLTSIYLLPFAAPFIAALFLSGLVLLLSYPASGCYRRIA